MHYAVVTILTLPVKYHASHVLLRIVRTAMRCAGFFFICIFEKAAWRGDELSYYCTAYYSRRVRIITVLWYGWIYSVHFRSGAESRDTDVAPRYPVAMIFFAHTRSVFYVIVTFSLLLRAYYRHVYVFSVCRRIVKCERVRKIKNKK